jgi:hypothetical protein
VNGRLAAEVVDDDPEQSDAAGILALQLHSGPPTVAEFKDVRLKVLKRAEASSLLDVVRCYADTMIERGRDIYGPQKGGLLLSALDRMTLSPLDTRPAPPAGMRREDRPGEPWSALTGANPQLDENLLRVLYALSKVTGDPKYARVADEELRWFLKNALSAKTGLLPWGEHMCWDVIEDKPISGGNDAVHEFARPWVLWDRCFELAPEESRRFALGLWEHQIADHRTGAFDRHAPYFEHGPRDGMPGFTSRRGGARTSKRATRRSSGRSRRSWRGSSASGVQKDGTLAVTIGPLDCETAAAMVPDPLAGRLRAFAAKRPSVAPQAPFCTLRSRAR